MKTIVYVVVLFALTLPAAAAVDLGDGACRELSTGEQGLWNGTTADDDGCVTLTEYEAVYGDPTEKVVSSNPTLEPDAPTVVEYFESPQVRLEHLGLIIE